jgi:RNA polymerase sigma factor (sigma-70 family)
VGAPSPIVLGMTVQPASADATPPTATFESLLRDCALPAFHLARVMLGDAYEAEDAVQEAAVRAWTRFDRFRPDSSFRAWFLTIVANQCRSMRRTRWWRLRTAAELPDGVLASHEERTISRLRIQDLLGELTVDQQTLLYLSFGLDLPHAETGRILGLRTGTVKTRVYRLVKRLKLAAEEGTP